MDGKTAEYRLYKCEEGVPRKGIPNRCVVDVSRQKKRGECETCADGKCEPIPGCNDEPPPEPCIGCLIPPTIGIGIPVLIISDDDDEPDSPGR